MLPSPHIMIREQDASQHPTVPAVCESRNVAEDIGLFGLLALLIPMSQIKIELLKSTIYTYIRIHIYIYIYTLSYSIMLPFYLSFILRGTR